MTLIVELWSIKKLSLNFLLWYIVLEVTILSLSRVYGIYTTGIEVQGQSERKDFARIQVDSHEMMCATYYFNAWKFPCKKPLWFSHRAAIFYPCTVCEGEQNICIPIGFEKNALILCSKSSRVSVLCIILSKDWSAWVWTSFLSGWVLNICVWIILVLYMWL